MTQAGWLAMLVAVTLPHLAVTLGSGGLSVLMPLLQRDLGLSTVQVGLLSGARFAGLIVLSIPAAMLVTRLGLRRSIVFLQVGFGLTLVALAAAAGPLPAMVAVAASSAFFAAANPATTTAVIVRFPASLRAQAMNTKQVGVPLANLLTALLLPAISLVIGWRGAFLVVVGLVLMSAALSWALYTEAPPSETVTVELPGAHWWALLRERPIQTMTAMQTLLMAAQASVLAYFVIFFIDRHMRLGVAAAYLALMQLTAVFSRVLWGVVAHRVFDNRRRPALLCVVAIATVGVAALALIPQEAPRWMLAALAVLLGVGLMAYAGMIELVRAELVAPSATASATGLGYAVGAVGGMAGPPAVGLIAERYGFPAAWGALAAVLVCATVLALYAPEPVRTERS